MLAIWLVMWLIAYLRYLAWLLMWLTSWPCDWLVIMLGNYMVGGLYDLLIRCSGSGLPN